MIEQTIIAIKAERQLYCKYLSLCSVILLNSFPKSGLTQAFLEREIDRSSKIFCSCRAFADFIIFDGDPGGSDKDSDCTVR